MYQDKKAQKYSILVDHLGTPTQMYDEEGLSTWYVDLDSFGKVRLNKGDSKMECPFRYQGQYEDVETGLYYNRFRYYDPEDGNYISQDLIGLSGGNPTLYGYVGDPSTWLDVFGLAPDPELVKALDNRLKLIGAENVKKGVYSFNEFDTVYYAGSAGTGKGTNPMRKRLIQHINNNKLTAEGIDSLNVIGMDGAPDQKVWDQEAKTIKENGGIGDENASNQRRPPNTGCLSKKSS